MSNINNQEPQAHGLIKFKTSFGDLDIELFTKQCPKATQNFVQLCLDGFYQGSVFERVEKDFIAIGGSHHDSLLNEQFLPYYPDEFHSRLRFNRRGLLASANTKKDENGVKFFFTLAATPELQGKHTIFGRLKSDSVYSIVDLNDVQVDEDFRPYSEQMITEVIVIENPWPNLKPDSKNVEYINSRREKNTKEKAHDDELVYDPLLKPKSDLAKIKKLSFGEDSEDEDEDESPRPTKAMVNELNAKQENVVDRELPVVAENFKTNVKEEQRQGSVVDNQPVDSKEERLREIRARIQQLKEQASQGLLNSKTLSERRRGESSEEAPESSHKQTFPNSETGLNTAYKKGSRKRERETLEKLREFKKKLKESIKEKSNDTVVSNGRIPREEQPDDSEISDYLVYLDKVDGDDWLRHKFEAEDEERLAKDANTKSDDWYSVDDPRSRVHNPRRHRYSDDDDRYESAHKSKSHRGDSKSHHGKDRRRHGHASHHSR